MMYLLLSYLVVLSLAYLFQEKLIFLPDKLDKTFDFQLPSFAKEITLKTTDNVNINAILYEQPTNKQIILYFHGNAGSLYGWKDVAHEFLALGSNVLIIDYRGYGKSEGKFSEQGFYADAEAAYEYAKKLGYSDHDIVFYGRSVGSGVAVEMAVRHPVKGLILEGPFINFPKLAMKSHWFLMPMVLLRYKFDNLQKASRIKMPVLILHGSDDEIIPVGHSQILGGAIKGAKVVIISGGKHNNLDSFVEHAEAIKRFLEERPSLQSSPAGFVK